MAPYVSSQWMPDVLPQAAYGFRHLILTRELWSSGILVLLLSTLIVPA
jgi:hypothetical protein